MVPLRRDEIYVLACLGGVEQRFSRCYVLDGISTGNSQEIHNSGKPTPYNLRTTCKEPGGNMAERKVAAWQKIYQEALAETDRGKLMTKICEAESLLFSRLQREPIHRNEAIAIYDAIHSLRLLLCGLYAKKKREEVALAWRRSA